jgi:hypothetical protein
MSKKNDPNKPAIFADYVSDDDIAAELSNLDSLDPSRIPGYHEIVQANEIAAADQLTWDNQYAGTGITKEKIYKLIGARPQELPVNFVWLRVAGPDGGNSYSADADRMWWTERGYRPATLEDITRHGWRMPPAAHESGGMIRRLDTALFVVDGRRARAIEKRRADQAAQAENRDDSETVGKATGVPISHESERGTFTETFQLTTTE